MPTGRITFPGGLSAPSLPVPTIPGNPRGVKDGANSSGPAGVKSVTPGPVIYIDYGAEQTAFYGRIVPEVAKANYVYPSNQGRMAQASFVRAMTPASANHSPSRSQFSEGYTDAIQVFAASNTWQIAGETSKGTRAKQPSTKFVSPFSTLPIPTRMPWDL